MLKDELRLTTMFLAPRETIKPQVDDPHALLLVELQPKSGGADVIALLELIEIVWREKLIPRDVTTSVSTLPPGTAIEPL